MTSTLVTVAGAVTAAVLGTAALGGGHASTPNNELPHWVTKPCKTEDSLNCHWNAKTQGNGVGKSFIIRKLPNTGERPLVCIFYVKKADRKFDQCWRYDGGGI